MQFQNIIASALFLTSGVMAIAHDAQSACNNHKYGQSCEWDDGTPGTGRHSGHCWEPFKVPYLQFREVELIFSAIQAKSFSTFMTGAYAVAPRIPHSNVTLAITGFIWDLHESQVTLVEPEKRLQDNVAQEHEVDKSEDPGRIS
ncbi:hypothetical protein FDENT_14168 [Fusarium denticulatum]|uniref:Uncharacterized protein n=1 Tax=Fusarium denticulatum TaxID=48507 RepID=A0A8H5WGY7_9HYPO|nr:hypothetical protein FDENT_14168 [Fusarium denticulatum]